MQRIRTLAEEPIRVLVWADLDWTWRRIAPEARRLRKLGLSWVEIGRALGVTDKTARKAGD